MKKEFIISIFYVALGFSSFLFAPAARAAIFTVTNNSDSGAGSLRQAILDANDAPTDDTIEFASALSGASIVLNGQIDIGAFGSGDLIINGLGANRLTIDGGTGNNRIFETGDNVNTIRGLTIQNGGSLTFEDAGSAIRVNFGTFILDGVVLRNNQSIGGAGSVFFQLGANHSIVNSTITGNTDTNCGGFRVDATNLTVINTTVSGNNSANNGGGFCVYDGSVVTIRNSTVAGNHANGNGGFGGGGISIFDSIVNLGNTIVAGNTAPTDADIHRFFFNTIVQTVGGNIIGSNSSVTAAFPQSSPAGTVNANGDKVGAASALLSPRLAPLGNYGGTTLTQALLPNSPAINAGNNISGTPSADQRGAARAGAVDSGAYETNAAFIATLPDGRVGLAYNQTLVPDNGSFNYTQTGGTLPPGLNLATSFAPMAVVALGGTPEMAGTYNFAVAGTNGVDSVITNYSINILAAPTAAKVTIGGRVLTASETGIRNAIVTLTDRNGNKRTELSGKLGFYRFADIEAGETYIVSVSAKRFTFSQSARVITATEDLTEVNFTAQESWLSKFLSK